MAVSAALHAQSAPCALQGALVIRYRWHVPPALPTVSRSIGAPAVLLPLMEGDTNIKFERNIRCC